MIQYNLQYNCFDIQEAGFVRRAFLLTHPIGYFQSIFQVALCEIKAGLWVYSGFQMRGQALSYVQCHFCNSMVDLDLFFVQVTKLIN